MQQAITHLVIRNPFGTMDVPGPDDSEVMDYAATATLAGDAADINAAAWTSIAALSNPLEGIWASRWNGGADPTIAGDPPDRWKEGRAEVRVAGSRIYLRFDWDQGRRHGLIDAAREGAPPGRKVHQSDHACDHAAMGRARGRWHAHRRMLSERTAGFQAVS
ncbi:hypothetical protein ACVIJW_005487 [Bradyrhizobium barranii subsp. barranii]